MEPIQIWLSEDIADFPARRDSGSKTTRSMKKGTMQLGNRTLVGMTFSTAAMDRLRREIMLAQAVAD
jgi:hypothetical protein